MRYRSILLFGAPGSGKGTQGKIIGTIPGFYHSATGDIFRSLDLQSEMGRKFWEYASRGELVPDEFTINLWKQYIKGMEMINQFHPETEFLVLDGIPRNVKQAKLLEDTIDVVKIIYLRGRPEQDGRAPAPPGAEGKPLRRRQRRGDPAAAGGLRDARRGRCWTSTRRTRSYRIDATMSQIRVLSEIVKMLVPLKEADGRHARCDSDASSSDVRNAGHRVTSVTESQSHVKEKPRSACARRFPIVDRRQITPGSDTRPFPC